MEKRDPKVERAGSSLECGPVAVGMEDAFERLRDLTASGRTASGGADVEELEREVRESIRELETASLQALLQRSIDSDEVRRLSLELVRALPQRLRNVGRVAVQVKISCGGVLVLSVPYWRRKGGGPRGRKQGVYPALVVLGIVVRCTPLLASEVGIVAAVSSSFEEARILLSGRGVRMDTRAIQSLVRQLASRTRSAQACGELPFFEGVTGRRVVISCDGGKVRTRKYKRGPRTKKGWRRFHTPWREPTLLIIYCVDADGRAERGFAPVIDGTLGGVDVLFALIGFYLTQLQIGTADRILWIADGARWIWTRVAQLTKDLDLPANRVLELIDFYHAVEHLAKIAALRRSWTAKQRTQWYRRQRKDLKNGLVDRVIEAIKKLCVGRAARKIKTHLGYFVKNRIRLDYPHVASLGLPIGSGAVESAIRRVINQRLKNPGTFWMPENAEALLLIRAYFKAGRWKSLKTMAFQNTNAISV